MTIPAKMYNTGADYALSIIGGKWKPVILYLLAALRYLNYWGEQKAATSSTVKIMCTNQMKSAGDDGLCVITRQHLHHWKQEIVKQD